MSTGNETAQLVDLISSQRLTNLDWPPTLFDIWIIPIA